MPRKIAVFSKYHRSLVFFYVLKSVLVFTSCFSFCPKSASVLAYSVALVVTKPKFSKTFLLKGFKYLYTAVRAMTDPCTDLYKAA